jgi:hypothetical protein
MASGGRDILSAAFFIRLLFTERYCQPIGPPNPHEIKAGGAAVFIRLTIFTDR